MKHKIGYYYIDMADRYHFVECNLATLKQIRIGQKVRMQNAARHTHCGIVTSK